TNNTDGARRSSTIFHSGQAVRPMACRVIEMRTADERVGECCTDGPIPGRRWRRLPEPRPRWACLVCRSLVAARLVPVLFVPSHGFLAWVVVVGDGPRGGEQQAGGGEFESITDEEGGDAELDGGTEADRLVQGKPA